MSSGDGAVFQDLEADDPRTAGPYRLAARLGAGGMGKVYLSYTPAGRPVAIKVIRPELAEDPEFRRRFKAEVQAAQRVQGLFTAPVVDSDGEGRHPWLATAFVQGPTLTSAVAAHGALPLPTVLLLVAGIAEALQAVHAAGLVHRDLKPSNVLLAADGPRVIDFGIARAADSTALTDSGATIGTPAFMAPEQASGREITPATDVFALGQVAAFAALASPAYGDGPSHAVLYRIVHEEPDLAGLPPELLPLVSRCLAKDPAQRPSLTEVVALCQAASDGTQLRRPDQWLPGAVAAEIPERHALPGYSPTAVAAPDQPPTQPAATQPAAQPPAQPPATHAAATQPAAAQPPLTQPGTPAQGTPAQAAAGPATPPPGMPPAPGAPAQSAAAAAAAAYQMTQAAGPAGPPPAPGFTPPSGPHQPPAPQQFAQGGPQPYGGPGRPGGPQQFGYPGGPQPAPHQGGPYPYRPVLPLPPKKKSKAPFVVAGVAAALVLAVVVPAGLKAASKGSGSDDAKSGSGTHSTATGGSHTGSGSGTDTGATTSPTHEGPAPEVHSGIQLADDYHLVLADADLKPTQGMDDDVYYYCSDIGGGCHFATDTNRFVLLDRGETGSLDTCLKDTRYTTQVELARLSPGSQICESNDSTVALITFKRASKSTEPSTYAVIDVTIWRNAIPATSS